MIDTLIENIKKKINLTLDETEQLFDKIFNGEVNTNSLTSLLDALDKKGETPDELAGATTSMRKNSKSIDVNHNQVIDCCGTGGLGKKMINVSTSVSFVLAAAGLKVAKHGNRTATGKSGSADFLEAAGINLNKSSEYFSDSLDKIGLGFLFAQNHHPGMKYVMEARKILGKKTIFNLIGPLSSPAQVKRQVIGVFDKKWMKPFAEALKENKVEHAYIVHSDDGMDEISPFAKTNIVELKDGNINEFTIDPKDLGINSNNKDNLKGKNAEFNAGKIVEIYKGINNEFSQSVALNVAAGLIVAGKENDFKNAFDKATKHLNSGNVFQHLEKIQSA